MKTGSIFTEALEVPLLNPFSAGVVVFRRSSDADPSSATAVESIVTGPFVLTFSSSRTAKIPKFQILMGNCNLSQNKPSKKIKGFITVFYKSFK